MNEDVKLEGGRMSQAKRVHDAVHRRPQSDRRTTHRFLRHLRANGCLLAPEPLGVLPDGTERLSFIEGSAATPPYLPEHVSADALVHVAKAVRHVHDAGAGFVWPVDDDWQGHDAVRPTRFDCIGHNDLGPWNMVFDGSTVSGIIDWDACGPSSRIWDFAYAVHHFVPFHQDSVLQPWGWSNPPNRYERLQLMVEAYGFDAMTIPDVLDAAIVRLASIGTYIAHRVRLGDPAFAVHAVEDHASAYFAASAHVVTLRKDFLTR